MIEGEGIKSPAVWTPTTSEEEKANEQKLNTDISKAEEEATMVVKAKVENGEDLKAENVKEENEIDENAKIGIKNVESKEKVGMEIDDNKEENGVNKVDYYD